MHCPPPLPSAHHLVLQPFYTLLYQATPSPVSLSSLLATTKSQHSRWEFLSNIQPIKVAGGRGHLGSVGFAPESSFKPVRSSSAFLSPPSTWRRIPSLLCMVVRVHHTKVPSWMEPCRLKSNPRSTGQTVHLAWAGTAQRKECLFLIGTKMLMD